MIVTGDAVCTWVAQKVFADHIVPQNSTAIGLTRNGILQAGFLFESFTGSSVIVHFRCDSPDVASRRLYWEMFHYVFEVVKCKRLTAIIPSWNLRSQNIAKRLGLQIEATLHDYFPEGDAIIFCMHKDACRWLSIRKNW